MGIVISRASFLVFLLALASAGQQTDPWPPAALLSPAALASQMQSKHMPHVFFVGFPMLYKGAHIQSAMMAGPCSKPEGLELLAKSVAALPHDADIVIYCGCCPFVRCPNIRPAYQALKDAGYTNVKVLQLDTNLHTDWVEKGYPTEK